MITIGSQILQGEPNNGGGGGGGTDSSVTIDPMTGAGWTDWPASSGSSTTWAGSKLTLSVPEGVAVAPGAGAHRDDGTSGDSYDVLANVDLVSGDGDTYGNVHIACGTSGADAVYLVVQTNGVVIVGRAITGSPWLQLTIVAGPDSGQRTGGKLWMRVSRRPGSLAFAWGVAATAGALPTHWTTVYTTTDTTYLDLASGPYVHIRIDAGGSGVTGGMTVDVLSIRTVVAPL